MDFWSRLLKEPSGSTINTPTAAKTQSHHQNKHWEMNNHRWLQWKKNTGNNPHKKNTVRRDKSDSFFQWLIDVWFLPSPCT